MGLRRHTIVSGIYIQDETVLLVENRWGKLTDWTLPGGQIELGEGVIDALKREFLEETHLEIKDVGPLCYIVQSCFPSFNDEAFIMVFSVTSVKGQLAQVSDGLIQKCAFVPFDKVESLVKNPSNAIPLVSFLRSELAGVPFYYFSEVDGRTQLKFRSK